MFAVVSDVRGSRVRARADARRPWMRSAVSRSRGPGPGAGQGTPLGATQGAMPRAMAWVVHALALAVGLAAAPAVGVRPRRTRSQSTSDVRTLGATHDVDLERNRAGVHHRRPRGASRARHAWLLSSRSGAMRSPARWWTKHPDQNDHARSRGVQPRGGTPRHTSARCKGCRVQAVHVRRLPKWVCGGAGSTTSGTTTAAPRPEGRGTAVVVGACQVTSARRSCTPSGPSRSAWRTSTRSLSPSWSPGARPEDRAPSPS